MPWRLLNASYLAAWSTLPPLGPFAEFIGRWSSADFDGYAAALGDLTERHYHEAAQEHFNEVLMHERDFWKMSWEGRRLMDSSRRYEAPSLRARSPSEKSSAEFDG
jgi:hypothetical protein